jgi:Flp pilus assembly pilin Flp
MNTCVHNIRGRRSKHTRGATMVEYVLLVILIVIVAMLGIKTFGNTVNNQFGSNNNSVTTAWSQ